MSEFGIPYMGSKSEIIKSLAMNFPQADNFYDLFGGGFSVTHYMIMHKTNRYKMFHYNEINKDITDFVQKAINGFYNYKNFTPEWVSREMFFQRLDDPYTRYIWSFGNKGTTYLFGKSIEEYKRSMHMAVVLGEFNNIAESILGFKEWPSEADTIKKRRLYMRQRVSWLNKKKKLPLSMSKLQRFQQLQQLLQLERLQQLQQLEQQLPNLSITSKDYREVEILPRSVVYCDIPYKDTAQYRNNFSHKDFFDWAANASFPVFISEYDVNDERFELIYEVDKRVRLAPKDKNGVQSIKKERLYWNRK